MHDTPADKVLHPDHEALKRKNEFHYRSMIGQLNYLASTTRLEIQFAVHQAARFSHNPRMPHEKAVKRNGLRPLNPSPPSFVKVGELRKFSRQTHQVCVGNYSKI